MAWMSEFGISAWQFGREAFANPDRWCDEDSPYLSQHCYAVCFFDYLEADVAADYIDLFFRPENNTAIQRTEDPVCGTVYLDVKGAAQGYWFNTLENTYSEENNLYLSPNDFLPSYHTFSTGHYITGLNTGIYSYVPASEGFTNRAFDEIADTNKYCFDHIYNWYYGIYTQNENFMDFSIIMQLSEDKQRITIEKRDTCQCDSIPWKFTDNAVTFYR